jgi:Fe-S cluster assembly protein SufD
VSTTATLPFGELIATAPTGQAGGRLRALREAGAARFAEVGLPGTKDEEWRFTPVGALGKIEFRVPADSGAVTPADLTPFRFGDSWPTLVLVDGRYSAELSTLDGLPDGVVVTSLGRALAEGRHEVEAHLGRTATPTETPFTALSAATFTDGLFLQVPEGATVPTPVHLLSVATDASSDAMLAPRSLVLLGDGATATVVESYTALTQARYFTNTVLEAHLGAGARLDHTRIQRENEAAWHIGFTHVDQATDSHYREFALAMGGHLARHNVHARHCGERVETLLYGLYLTSGDQLADTHSAVFHDRPNCNSWEVYKGVLADRSRAVFNGKVLVDRLAQKTDAKQTNRNLLLSDTARVDTKPQLEIFADDVRCTHGATIGKLNPLQRYYLKTRGIGGKKAEKLLVWAFAAEVMAEIAEPAVRERLETLVHLRLDELTA